MSFEFDPARIWADLRRTEDRVDRGDSFGDDVLNAGKSAVRYGAEHASAIRFGSMSALGFSSRGDLMFDLFEDHYARVKRLEKAFALSGPMALDLLRTDLASLNVSAILDQLLETAQDIALYYAGSMAVGGFLGGVLGSLAGGVGAAPGAVLGATLGIEACTVVLGIQGMVEVLTTLSQIITEVSACYVEGVVEAWGATPQDHESAPPGMFLRSGNAHFASEHFAHGHALIIKALLIALIGYVAGRAVSAASKTLRLEEIASNSHLGKPVAQWLEKNQDALPQYAERLERTTAKPSTPDVPEPEVSSPAPYRGKEASSSSPNDNTGGEKASGNIPPETVTGSAHGSGAKGGVDFSSFEVSGLKAERILPGTSDNVAVIGRTMGNGDIKGVRDYAGALREQGVNVEIFDGKMISDTAKIEFGQLTAGGRRLTNQELLQTKMYQENKAWAAKLKSDGYTVIDLGNPYPKQNGFSPFYAIEKQTIFSGTH